MTIEYVPRAERNGILSLAHSHCVAEMLQSSRCPHCKGDECPKCHATVRVVPHADMVAHRFGLEMRQSVERLVDEVIRLASGLSKIMDL